MTIIKMILFKKGQLTLITETVVGFKKHSWTQLDTTLGQRYALLATKSFSSGTVLKYSFEVFDYLTNRLWLQKSSYDQWAHLSKIEMEVRKQAARQFDTTNNAFGARSAI